MNKPKIGIIPGDPGGIGPELIAKLLADRQTQQKADILLIGDNGIIVCLLKNVRFLLYPLW